MLCQAMHEHRHNQRLRARGRSPPKIPELFQASVYHVDIHGALLIFAAARVMFSCSRCRIYRHQRRIHPHLREQCLLHVLGARARRKQ